MNKDISIKVCTGTGGVASGGEEVLSAFRNAISSAGLEVTIYEKCPAHRVGCRGFCAKDVLVDVIINGEKTTYKHIKPDMVMRIFNEHILNGKPVSEWTVGKDYQIFHNRQTKVVLSHCGEIDPEDINPYMEVKGYTAASQALTSMSPEEIVDVIKTSNLRGRGGFKRLTANLFYRVINIFSDTPIPKNTGDFRLLDRKVVEVLNRLPERTRFMKGLFAWVGFKQTTGAFDREPRYAGQTKMKFWKLWNFALDGITLFSTSALRIWTYIGFAISCLSFMYALFLIIKVLVLGKDVPGYASIMVSLLFLGGLILVSLGIIGEYLGRIYEEVKNRPLYVISDTYGFNQKPLGSQNGKGSLPQDACS